MNRRGWSNLRQWWWIAFVLGVLMVNYPVLHIFDRGVVFLGIPLLFLYLLVGWVTGIVVVGLYVWALQKASSEEER